MQSKIFNFFQRLISREKSIVFIFLLAGLAVSIQTLLISPQKVAETNYEIYNNYQIYKNSFFHLINQLDLYSTYPEEYFDLYKYSPTFSVFFGLFALLPDWMGLTFWNLLNDFVLLFSVYSLQKISLFQKGLILLLCLVELITSMQNQQSNALIAGLSIYTFSHLEKGKYWSAAFFVMASFFIKLFGIATLVLFIFYPKKWKLAAWSVLWFVLLLCLPLIFAGPSHYLFLLKSWGHLLASDHSLSYGYSVLGWLHSWFGLENSKLVTLVAGIILLFLPLLNTKNFTNTAFRYLMLSSILIWIVIFNHKAESPTYIIAMAGVSVWYVLSRKSKANSILFIFAFILTSLSPTDFFPRSWLNGWVMPYSLKAVPSILIWFRISWQLLFFEKYNIVFPFSPKIER